MPKFIFDLDDTITSEETLPLIAHHFDISERIDKLTQETVKGNIPFIESFIQRVHILKDLPVSKISSLLEHTKLHAKVFEFIKAHLKDCIIATGNLNCYITALAQRLGCCCYASQAIVENDRVLKISEILRKEDIVRHYKDLGEKVVFIGHADNDVEAMRLSNVSIASALTHTPANSVLAVTDYLVLTQEALCRQLNQLL